MDEREFNVRSDEVVEMVESLAQRMGKSTTEVVVDALRRLDRETSSREVAVDLTPAQRSEHESFMALVRSLRPYIVPGVTSDHRDMYDEFGLPK